jgi:hypothetical protein
MNYLKLFENFREQPLEKQDIIDLLEGTGIEWTKIYEYPFRDTEDKKFYLAWFVTCKNPEDWVYQPPRNYKVNIKENELEFICKKEVSSEALLFKISTYWKDINEFLIEIIKDVVEIDIVDSVYFKDNKFIFKRYKFNNIIWISNKKIWSHLKDKYSMDYISIKYFLWISLEDILDIKIGGIFQDISN